MVVLVTGSNGFLGHYLVPALLEKRFKVIGSGKGEDRLNLSDKNYQYSTMDFTDPYQVHDVFEKFKPGIVIHAGANSKVDDCELNQWEAYRSNVEGTINMLLNAEALRAFFVFISTDFIFNGKKGMYRESDAGDPVNFYGRTKLEAEELVQEYEHGWSIVRTILVYGKPFNAKDNILTIVKKKLEAGEDYKVVDDQVRTPTYVEDLAAAIVRIVEKKASGIFHIGGDEIMTPYQMASTVADLFNLNKELLHPVTENTLNQPAKRPLKTGLCIDKARELLGYQPISFKEGLRKTFEDQKK